MSDSPIDQHRATVAQQLHEEGEMFAQAFLVHQPLAARSKRLKEDIFRNVFFPMFRELLTGQGKEHNVYDMKLGNWITVAGNANSAVEVYDASGRTLFTVPPVFDVRATTPSTKGNSYLGDEKLPTIEHVIKSTQLYQSALPAQGNRYLSEELSKRAIIMKSNADLSDAEKAWNEIFALYGEDPVFGGAAKQQQQSPSAATDPGETDYEFDAP